MKMILQFIFLTPIMVIADILAYPLVPIAVLFADPETGRLPRGFRWLETFDDLGWEGGMYEPQVRAVHERWGRRAGLIYWLWRNKAYTLHNYFRAQPNYGDMTLTQSGATTPPKWGPFYWLGRVRSSTGSWFDLQAGIGLGIFYIYARMGWKIRPLFSGDRPGPDDKSATNMFTGISLRSDDWDDANKKKKNKSQPTQ